MPRSLHHLRRAFTLAEAIVATALVGVLSVSVLNASASAAQRRGDTARKATAALLAQELIDEIISKPLDDPDGVQDSPVNRASYDDVDDYRALSESPPRKPDGTAMPGMTGWSRTVALQWVTTSTLANSAVDTGLRKITVTVTLNSKVMLTRTAIKSRTWETIWP